MCGFVGVLTREGAVPTEAVARAAAAIAHRGPDDEGLETRDQVCLAFRRLAILDLSPAGHQPMASPDGRFAMVFNGEIYNYVELRDELRALGHHFRSSGDSEVLLRAYMQWGADALPRLRGMFALAIHDRTDGSLLLARDRFGIKPLYLCEAGRHLLFASELKAIRASGLWEGALNAPHFATVLAYGRSDMVPDHEATVLSGVRQVPAAHFVRVTRDGRQRTAAYWDPAAIRRDPAGGDVARFREVFDDAVRLHLRADVPVGVMLSGGMDSTALTCTMADMVRDTGASDFALHAFSYQTERFDEAEQIADTLRRTGAIAHVLGDEDATAIWSRLERVIWHHDELVHSPTVLVSYQLYALAAQAGIRVVLNGQGADESLGGYWPLVEHALYDRFRDGDPALEGELAAAAAFTDTTPERLRTRLRRLQRADRLRRLPFYTRVAAGRRLRQTGAAHILTPEFAGQARAIPPHYPGQSFSHAILNTLVSEPLPQYLRVEDRNSMAHGIESRVPFLDHVLVEHALTLPVGALMSGGWNKRILRDAMRGRIPDSVCNRAVKFGFPTGARDWFAGPLAGALRDLLAGSAAARAGWFNVAQLRHALDEHVAGRADHSRALFAFAQVNAWLELHARGWTR
jgi:asparagine synthase (glutamine-hydrolysing)